MCNRNFPFFVLLVLFLYVPVTSALEVGDRLVLGTVTTLDGQVRDQAYWNEKNTLVQVWATWCPFCSKQNAHLNQLIQDIPANSLNILTISVDNNDDLVHRYMKKNRYDFPVAMMTPALIDAIGKRRGVPELYILDKEGRVIQKDYGLMVDLDFFDLAKYAQP